jgi:hypothetical protein
VPEVAHGLASTGKAMQNGHRAIEMPLDGVSCMIRRSLRGILVVLSVASVPAWGQTRGSHNSGGDAKTRQAAGKQAPSTRKSCQEYGPGFVRLEGSSTCVQIGGAIGIDAGVRR